MSCETNIYLRNLKKKRLYLVAILSDKLKVFLLNLYSKKKTGNNQNKKLVFHCHLAHIRKQMFF